MIVINEVSMLVTVSAQVLYKAWIVLQHNELNRQTGVSTVVWVVSREITSLFYLSVFLRSNTNGSWCCCCSVTARRKLRRCAGIG